MKPHTIAIALLAMLAPAGFAQQTSPPDGLQVLRRAHTFDDAVQALLQGDATPRSGPNWTVFSSPGDDIGTVPFKLSAPGEGIGSVPFFMFSADFEGYFALVDVEGGFSAVIFGPSTIAGSTGSATASFGADPSAAPFGGTGDVLSMSWEHDSGLWGCRTIRVAHERSPGQGMIDFVHEFESLVTQAMALYPPNGCDPATSSSINIHTGDAALAARGSLPWRPTPTTAAAAAPGDTMSISWQHDMDGAGPLQPTTVTASTPKRNNESSSQQARRLGQMAAALQEIFPPNVPPPS